MKKMLFIILFGFITSCNHNVQKYTCIYSSIIDNYPKGVVKTDYDREICCILKFYNCSKDSIFIPYHGLGGMNMKSYFFIKTEKYETECSARFWYPHNHSRFIAPGDSVRIGVTIFSDQLDKLHLDRNIDIKDLDRKIKICYQYNSADSSISHLKTPPFNIMRSGKIDYIYNASIFVEYYDCNLESYP